MEQRRKRDRSESVRVGLLAATCTAAVLLAGCVSAAAPAARAPSVAARATVPAAASEKQPSREPELARWNPAAVSGKGFTVGPDVRVFALFAWLNAVGGYDRESSPPMDPLRARVRADMAAALKAVDPAHLSRWRGFAAARRLPVDQEVSSALALGMPPAFHPVTTTPAEAQGPGLDGFDRILSEFWAETGLEKLYRDFYRDELARLASRYDPRMLEADFRLVQGYLRLSEGEMSRVKVRIVPNPFDSRGTSYASARTGVLTVVEAPTDRPPRIDARAYARLFVDPLVANAPGTRSEVVRGLAAASRERPLVKGVLEEPADFASECLCRALAYRIDQVRDAGRNPAFLDLLWKKAQQDSDGGLTLVPWFFAELARFEADESMSLADFLGSALARLAK
jgi:hypothetical protein